MKLFVNHTALRIIRTAGSWLEHIDIKLAFITATITFVIKCHVLEGDSDGYSI
jgi:hypothetical protein